MSSQRLNKKISDLLICSRRKAEILIKEKKVLVNAKIDEEAMKVNPKIDTNKKDINKSHYEILMKEKRNRKTILFNSFSCNKVK